MIIIKPSIFQKYPELLFGFSTKTGNAKSSPFHFNLSLSVNDDPDIVWQNRELFFNFVGLSISDIVFQKQMHGDTVTIANEPGLVGESDAVITTQKGLGLAVSVADCTPIFLFDNDKKVIGAVHSGWRSTEKKILLKTLQKMSDVFGSDPGNIIAYLGPSISQKNYEVSKEVASLFDERYIKADNNKLYLDVAQANYDFLVKFGLRKENIQVSSLCTYENAELLHSYRREGQKSGRACGVIALKKDN